MPVFADRFRTRHHDEGANRHRAQPAGRAGRLRERCGDSPETWNAGSSRRSIAQSGRCVSDRRVGLPEGLCHETRHGGSRATPRALGPSRCWWIPRFPIIDYYAGATVVTPNHHEAETAATCASARTTEAPDRARAFRDTRAMRLGADDARRSGDVAGLTETPRGSCPPRRARSRTSPAPAIPSSRRWRSRWPRAQRWSKPPAWRTKRPASRSASSAPPR